MTIRPSDAMSALIDHDWPGNIRELENVIQRAVIMSASEIDLAQLPDWLKYKVPASDSGFVSLKEMEKQYISKVLASVENNKTRAAEILGIDRQQRQHHSEAQ